MNAAIAERRGAYGPTGQETGLMRQMARAACWKFLPGKLSEIAVRARDWSRGITIDGIEKAMAELVESGKVESVPHPTEPYPARWYQQPRPAARATPAPRVAPAAPLSAEWASIVALSEAKGVTPKEFTCSKRDVQLEPETCIESYTNAAFVITDHAKRRATAHPCATCKVGAALRRLWAEDEPTAVLIAAAVVLQEVRP